ncbi:MAG: hypothetical protein NC120_06485 [Ruminococcus sp.]|nr:hypothetical protein [Ruminococcus sp.]
MFKFKNEFSYDDILSPSEVKEKGILFNNERFVYECYSENGIAHYERLFYTDDNNVKAPFSGLLYALYPDGIVSGYSFFKDGYHEGEDAHFYDDGAIAKYTNYHKDESRTLIIEWSKDGTISRIEEMFNVGNRQKRIEYDESGNIINQYER